MGKGSFPSRLNVCFFNHLYIRDRTYLNFIRDSEYVWKRIKNWTALLCSPQICCVRSSIKTFGACLWLIRLPHPTTTVHHILWPAPCWHPCVPVCSIYCHGTWLVGHRRVSCQNKSFFSNRSSSFEFSCNNRQQNSTIALLPLMCALS